jgi:drug/metabolite transporter, DME family
MSRRGLTAVFTARPGLPQVALAGVLWGTGGLAVQLIRREAALSVLTISAYRTVIGAVILLFTVAVRRQWTAMIAIGRQHPVAVGTVGIGTALYQVLYFFAVVNVGVSVATVVSLGLAPVIMTIASSLLGRRFPDKDRIQVVTLAIAGLALVSVFGADHSAGPHPLTGVGLAVASGLVYAATTTLAGPVAGRHAPILVTTAATTFGGVALLPVAVLGATRVGAAAHHIGVVVGLIYLGVFTMALAYGLFYAGLRTIPQSSAVIATLLEPVTAAIAAAVILGERLDPQAVLGSLMILCAVLLLWLRHPEPEPVVI